MFGRIGPWELLLILVIALIIFGPGKLPEMGKALGKGLKEFKNATRELASKIEEDSSPEEKSGTKEKGQEN